MAVVKAYCATAPLGCCPAPRRKLVFARYIAKLQKAPPPAFTVRRWQSSGVAVAHIARHYVDGDSALQQLLLPVLDSR